jgi:hypothetical protein
LKGTIWASVSAKKVRNVRKRDIVCKVPVKIR